MTHRRHHDLPPHLRPSGESPRLYEELPLLEEHPPLPEPDPRDPRNEEPPPPDPFLRR
ncbi:MAG TPA: hypothetical protein VGF28_03240 [Thermoanaerobaculia bacterium]|jgi:hypothetical protein